MLHETNRNIWVLFKCIQSFQNEKYLLHNSMGVPCQIKFLEDSRSFSFLQVGDVTEQKSRFDDGFPKCFPHFPDGFLFPTFSRFSAFSEWVAALYISYFRTKGRNCNVLENSRKTISFLISLPCTNMRQTEFPKLEPPRLAELIWLIQDNF